LDQAAGLAIVGVLLVVAIVICEHFGWTGRRSVRAVLEFLAIPAIVLIAASEDLFNGFRNRKFGPARHKREDAGED